MTVSSSRRLLIGAVVAALVLAVASPARAQDDTPGEHLGGYVAQAAAMAVSFQPVFPALLPTGDAPFEATLALTNANVKSGGNAFGRASTLWPGSAAANLGPLIGTGAQQPAIGALIPQWPVLAEANQRSGEVVKGAPPAVVMKATGHPDQATGDSRLLDVDVPGMVTVEQTASTSSAVVTDADVTSESRVTLHGVSLVGGHITAETIRSSSFTTSNGSTATSDGDVDIEGLRIGGVEVSLTDDGFEVTGLPPGAEQFPGAGGEPFPNQSPEEHVQSVLENLGARITLFESVGSAAGGTADRLSTGVVLSLDNPAAGQGPIPPGHFDVILASSSSSALATEPFTFELPELTPSGSIGGVRSVSVGTGPEVKGSTVADVGSRLTTAGGGGATGRITSEPAPLPGTPAGAYRFGGVPVNVVVGLLVAAAVAARYVRRFLDRMIFSSGSRARE